MPLNRKYVGETLDDFLREEGILEEVEARAAKKLLAFQILNEMKKRKLTKVRMAKKMHTSRSSLDRILDPKNSSVSLSTLERAAAALGKRLKVELV